MLYGFAFIVVAALCGGAFTLPMKYTRRFAWENTWLWGSFFTMILIPWVFACFVLPHPALSVFGAPWRSLLAAVLFGFGWGLGTVTFGTGINMVGLSLGYAIIMGINTAVGSLLPMAVLTPAEIHTSGGHIILFGIFACIVGVCLCGYAGIVNERTVRQKNSGSDWPKPARALKGMFICLLAGVLSAFMNLGFSFAQGIAQAAIGRGASSAVAGLPIWLSVFLGAFPAVILCCGYLQIRRGTHQRNFGMNSSRDLFLTFILGLLWFGAIFFYGVGASRLGHVGTSVGWAVNISASLLLANALGFATGEWKGAPVKSMGWLLAGLGVVLAAMATMAYGNAVLVRS
jgi:L-rhamnose-H+ transport protein